MPSKGSGLCRGRLRLTGSPSPLCPPGTMGKVPPALLGLGKAAPAWAGAQTRAPQRQPRGCPCLLRALCFALRSRAGEKHPKTQALNPTPQSNRDPRAHGPTGAAAEAPEAAGRGLRAPWCLPNPECWGCSGAAKPRGCSSPMENASHGFPRGQGFKGKAALVAHRSAAP